MLTTISMKAAGISSSGALFVAFTLAPASRAAAQLVIADEGAAVHVAKATQALAGSLKTNPLLDAWIKIAPDGKVTVFTGKVGAGTGVRTALLQVAAEELDMKPSLITFLTADTGASPDEGLTAGSHTMADSGSALLNAAAQVRALLVEGAAKRFGVDARTLTTADAVIKAPDGRTMTYGDAIRTVDLHRSAAPTSPLKVSGDVHGDRHVAAARRHPEQGDGRRQLRAGHGIARHAARTHRDAAGVRSEAAVVR